ncbi:MAG TPA: methyltransferase domain-containing protein [Ignavibacteria bacterium]
MILIIYTTAYRKGSDMFARVANTMYEEIKQRYTGEIICRGIFGKKNLTELFCVITEQDKQIDEYHFIGHSGMYGPMYGTTAYPEQYSPYELRKLVIPFSANAKAYFHCCRSARWFAPFFSEQFKVETFGYYWYTTFSSDKKKYKRVRNNSESVYAAGCIGKKSHGLIGSLKKYSKLLDMELMLSFKPREEIADTTYNKVADLYDKVFQDIKIRKDEWNWICKHFPEGKNIAVADIGCGNGALLKEIAPRIKVGMGFDTSANIIESAIKLNKDNSNISFQLINGPSLPIEEQSIDLIISLLSFRYLDWDPLMEEIKRVLKPDGKILIIDMVTVPAKWHEFPMLLKSKISQYVQRFINPIFYKNLTQLVTDPAWNNMLKHNPIRSEHEMKWYLESRFPNKKVEKINIGWNSCILAFDSGNIESIKDINLTYP